MTTHKEQLKTQALSTHGLHLVSEEREKIIKEEASKEENRQGVEVKQCYGSKHRFKMSSK